MKKTLTIFEKLFSAVAFAECGEHETARLLMKEREPSHKRSRKHHVKGNTDEVPVAGAVG